jgi:hypothetical protein
MIFSGIPHPTAALFLSGNFIDSYEQVYLITDDAKIFDYIGEVGSWIWGYPVRRLEHPGEIIALGEYHERIIIIKSDLLRVAGNLEAIRRAYIYSIDRESLAGQNILIERLIDYGYHQSDYPGESGTYKREGSIIRIWKEDREYLIEYFDDTIESIVEISPRGRAYRDSFTIFSLHPYISDNVLPISTALTDTLRDMPSIMIGCEFLREREYLLANIRDIIEFSSMSREGSVKVDIARENIETLPAFLEYMEFHKDQ